MGDVEGQRHILTEGLAAAMAMETPGTIVDLPLSYIDDDWKADPLSWSRKRQDRGQSRPSSTRGGDSRTERSDEPVYQNEQDREAAEAVAWDDQCHVCIGLPEPA